MPDAIENESKRVFTLQEARDLLPLVRRVTADAVSQVHSQINRLEALTEEDSEFEEVRSLIDATVNLWIENVENLGAEVKGLWLVDFDNGQGYYCWRFPEDELDHFHTYEQGFDTRTLIC